MVHPSIFLLSIYQLRIPDALAEALPLNSEELGEQIGKDLKAFNDKWGRTLRGEGGTSPAAGAQTGGTGSPTPPARLLCRPVFDETEKPIDVNKEYTFPEEAVVPMETLTEPLVMQCDVTVTVFQLFNFSFKLGPAFFWDDHDIQRILAGGPISRQNSAGIHVWVGGDFSLYLVNTGDGECRLGPGELFGFNTGAFSEMVSSNARCSKDVLHFCIKLDSDTVVYEKAAVPLADLICDLAGERGVIDIQVQDHNLKPATEAWSKPLFTFACGGFLLMIL